MRHRQIRNFLAINLLALGAPMILMGDEVRRTQLGNNNAYCQDNELSWFDWSLTEKHGDLFCFVKELIRFRLSLPGLSLPGSRTLAEQLKNHPIHWHGNELGRPDWGPQSRSVSFTVEGLTGWFQVIINAHWEDQAFELPEPPAGDSGRWRRILDTSLESPEDFRQPAEALPISTSHYLVVARSIVVLVAPLQGGGTSINIQLFTRPMITFHCLFFRRQGERWLHTF